MIDGKVVIAVKSNADQVAKSFGKLDRSLNKTTRDATKTTAKMKGLTATMVGLKGAAKTLGITLAAVAIVKLGKDAVKASSDFEETGSKFRTVFQDVAEEAQKTAKVLEDSYGLSKQSSRELLSATGDLLTGFGFTGAAALDLADKTNKLAIDLASFTNFSGGAAGASAALTKALLGERESIKSLGIAITETDLRQFAEDQGKVFKELTRQEKAVLTLDLAYRQSKNAVGDFARTSGSFANQSRQLSENLNNLKVQLGDKVLPALTDLAAAFVKATEDGSDFLEVMKGIGETFKFFRDGVDLVVSGTRTALTSIKDTFKVGISAISGFITGSNEKLKKALDDTASTFKKNVKDLVEDTKDLVESGDKVGEKLVGAFIDLDGAVKSTIEGTKALKGEIGSVATDAEPELESLAETFKDLGEDIKNSLADAFTDGLLDPLEEGESALDRFRNVFSNVLRDISKQLASVSINNLLNGKDGKSGIFGSLLTAAGAIIGGVSGGPDLGGAGARAQALAVKPTFANGGIVKGFASGGIIPKGDDQLAGVSTGEMVLTKGQQKNLFDIANGKGGNGTIINITPPAGFEAQVEQKPDNETDIFFKKVAGVISSPRSNDALDAADFRRSEVGVQAA